MNDKFFSQDWAHLPPEFFALPLFFENMFPDEVRGCFVSPQRNHEDFDLVNIKRFDPLLEEGIPFGIYFQVVGDMRTFLIAKVQSKKDDTFLLSLFSNDKSISFILDEPKRHRYLLEIGRAPSSDFSKKNPAVFQNALIANMAIIRAVDPDSLYSLLLEKNSLADAFEKGG